MYVLFECCLRFLVYIFVHHVMVQVRRGCMVTVLAQSYKLGANSRASPTVIFIALSFLQCFGYHQIPTLKFTLLSRFFQYDFLREYFKRIRPIDTFILIPRFHPLHSHTKHFDVADIHPGFQLHQLNLLHRILFSITPSEEEWSKKIRLDQ